MKYIDNVVKNFPELSSVKKDVTAAFSLLVETFKNGGKLLLCGNGGSAADCDHIAGELLKGFMLKRSLNKEDSEKLREYAQKLQYGFPCIPLTAFSAAITAVANDNDPNMIFAQQIFALGKSGDTLMALSTSGNSANIVAAAKVAKAIGMKVLAVTGKKDSALSDISDITIKLPETETYRVQELTLPLYHALCADIEEAFF